MKRFVVEIALCAMVLAGMHAAAMPIGVRTMMHGRAAVRQAAESTLMVSFDANGGSLAEEEATIFVEVGGALGERALPVPTRDGQLFAGWFTAEDDGEKIDVNAAITEDVTYYAHWIPKTTILIGVDESYAAGSDGSFVLALSKLVVSASTPKLTVKGLPAGVSFNAKTGVISGKATKPGTYKVTVSATNATVKKAVTATFEIVVPNLKSEVLPGLEQDKEAYGVVMCGVNFDADRIDCTHEAGWTVKVTGLPAGLKYDSKKNRITGVPTKAGTYTVTFTASKKGKKNEVATITLNVEGLPKWAIGTFTGNVKLKMENGELEEVNGTATMTVGAAGKISGKIAIDGVNWTFSAASYADVERPSSDVDDATFIVNATAKAGKATRAIVVEVGNGTGDGVRGAPALPAVAEGTFGDGEVKMWRNVWKDTGMAQLLAAWKGAYDYLTDDGVPLTLTIDANGGVKVAGTLANGRKLSFSTSLLYADEDLYRAILYAPPATETVKKGKKKVKVAYPAFYEETDFQNYPGEPSAGEHCAYRRQGVLASVGADSTGSGSIKYSTAYGQAPEGAAVTVTATSAKNSVFAYWTLNGEIVGYSASYKAVMGDGDFTGLEAVFRAKSDFKEKPPAPFVVDDGGGNPFEDMRVGVAFRARIDVDQEWHPVKFAAKNLPDGLKLNATTGVISGVPTKAGKKTVSFTATSVANTKLVSPAQKQEVDVAKLDGWAKGTFSGNVELTIENGAGELDVVSGKATMTVGATGKISGKFTIGKKSYSFSAGSYSECDGDTYAVESKLSYGKAKWPMSIAVWFDEEMGKGVASVEVYTEDGDMAGTAEMTRK